MRAMKSRGDVAARLFDVEFERLALVARGQRSFVTLFRFFEAFTSENGARLFFHILKHALKFWRDAARRFEH